MPSTHPLLHRLLTLGSDTAQSVASEIKHLQATLAGAALVPSTTSLLRAETYSFLPQSSPSLYGPLVSNMCFVNQCVKLCCIPKAGKLKGGPPKERKK